LGHIINEILENFGFPKGKEQERLGMRGKRKELSPRGSMTHNN
jgi:hypothetical protein